MSAQFFFVNATCHRLNLKLKKRESKYNWHIQRDTTNSLSLPIIANHSQKYKIKHGDDLVAKIFIDHNGLIEKIINVGHKFSVLTNDIHYKQHGSKRFLFHAFGLPTIYIIEKRHH